VESSDLYVCGGDFFQVLKDWDVVGLGIVGDEFFPILLKILEWETVLGTLGDALTLLQK